MWVGGIFTATSISPSPWSRQCPCRYAFRAGRNLPDKEFRYLRTVIVTAAVYWGFGSQLAPLPLTFQHWAGISPYTSPSGFAGTYGSGNQSHGPTHCGSLTLPPYRCTRQGAPLLPKVRGQFAEFLDQGSLVRFGLLDLPTCVGIRYGQYGSPQHAFRARSGPRNLPHHLRGAARTRFSAFPPTSLNGPRLAAPDPARDRVASSIVYWCRNLNLLSIAYAFRPRLRPDSPTAE